MASIFDGIASVSATVATFPEPKPDYRREIRTKHPKLRYAVEVYHLKTLDKWQWELHRIFDVQDLIIAWDYDGKSTANSIREAMDCLRLFRDIYRDADK